MFTSSENSVLTLPTATTLFFILNQNKKYFRNENCHLPYERHNGAGLAPK